MGGAQRSLFTVPLQLWNYTSKAVRNFCNNHQPRVPHISLVFREIWDTTALNHKILSHHPQRRSRFLVSHISRKTSEMWGTRRSLRRRISPDRIPSRYANACHTVGLLDPQRLHRFNLRRAVCR
jgi:hypothetical protein